MGTKVHHTSYLPGFCAMRDLNEDTDECWSQYYEDRTSGQNLFNGYQLRPSNGYAEYDKEMLKRTMLEHEAIFRKQVYELHRLYRTQKDMMDELKRGASRHGQPGTSHSNSFSSQIPYEDANKMFQMAHAPEATISNNRASLTATDSKKSILDFLNGSNMQPAPGSVRKEITLSDGDMFDSNQKGISNRMFDLQLPADVYIDCEDERSEKEVVAESSSVTTVPFDRTQRSDHENNVKLNSAMGEGPNHRDKSWKSEIHMRSGSITQSLADLNEPAREMGFEKGSGPASAKFLCPRTSIAENQGFLLPMKSNTIFSGLPSAFIKSRHCDEGISSNHLRIDDDETSRGWPFFNNEAGQSTSNMKLFSPDSSKGEFSFPSQQMQLNHKSNQVLSLDQNKRDAWFKSQHEISRRSPPDGRTAPPFPNSLSDTFLDYTDAASSLRSSWTKPVNGYSHVPLPVPSMQYFNGTTIHNHGNSSDKLQYIDDLRSHFRVGADPACYQNGFNPGVRLDYGSASELNMPPISFGKPSFVGGSHGNLEGCGLQNSQKDVHLNKTLQNGSQNGFTNQKINDSGGKCEDFSGALSWLKGKTTSGVPPLMELDLSQGYPQLKSVCSVANPGNERRQETGNSSNLFSLQNFLPSSQVKETTTKNVASDAQSSKKIFGFSIPEKTPQSSAFTPHQEQSKTDVTESNEKDEPQLPGLETQIPHGDLVSKSSGITSRNHFNLNFDLNSSDFSVEGEMLGDHLRVSEPTEALGIDLEVPVTLEEARPGEFLAKEAAESILLISSDKYSRLDDIPCPLSSTVCSHTLHWFAEVVSSNPEIVTETSDDSLDSFELMTLELEETKPEDLWFRSWGEEGQKDEEDGKSSRASLLFTKPRRGQARKRRQKRDFQRDVLPGISSLARHEVTEDLQTIGTLMKASGQSWQAGGTTRRNAGRNGTASRGRAGRRPRTSAVSVEETQVSLPPHSSLPPPQPAVAQPANNINTEIEVDGRNMIGWGRTTRRCRRQRLLPVTNVTAPLT